MGFNFVVRFIAVLGPPSADKHNLILHRGCWKRIDIAGRWRIR